MAVQFGTAWSSVIRGVGVVAGGWGANASVGLVGLLDLTWAAIMVTGAVLLLAADTERLVAVLREALDEPATDATSPPPALAPPPAPSTAGRRTALMGVALAAAAGLGVLAWRAGTSTRPKRADAAASATRAARAAINGRWQADVSYDWPNAHYTERFEFSGEGTALQGSASFLRVDRGILEGRVDSDGLAFVTRTRETLGGDGPGQEITHRYLGQLDGDELRFVMQTEGGSSAHRPVSFVARRAGS